MHAYKYINVTLLYMYYPSNLIKKIVDSMSARTIKTSNKTILYIPN